MIVKGRAVRRLTSIGESTEHHIESATSATSGVPSRAVAFLQEISARSEPVSHRFSSAKGHLLCAPFAQDVRARFGTW